MLTTRRTSPVVATFALVALTAAVMLAQGRGGQACSYDATYDRRRRV